MNLRSSRRRFLEAGLAGVAAGFAGCLGTIDPSGGDADESPAAPSTDANATTGTDATAERGTLPDAVALETVATGFEAPVDIAFAPDADRRYVADQVGVVRLHESGSLRDEPFLDLRDAVDYGGEKGLLGLALHPDFAENRRLFVRYSAPRRAGTPENYSHTFVLAEFEATADGRRVRGNSERPLLEIPEPQSNHNAGSIVFGPDGLLYVGVGDGGAGGDQGTGHLADWYERNAGGNGQDVAENLLGSVLRIDPDGREGGKPYGIPDDNPFAGSGPGLPEHYAWGFRNPWRMSFDGEDLYVADVGQSASEEVSVVEKGGNYGWNVKEGTRCYGASECPDATPGDVRGGEPLVDPIIEYPHSGGDVSGVSIIGGYVYRGSALPRLAGAYVFADLAAEGRLFAATPAGEGELWRTRVVDVAGEGAGKVERVLSFGRDAAGELYVLATGADGGGVHRLVAAE